jgi:hypothetical protein
VSVRVGGVRNCSLSDAIVIQPIPVAMQSKVYVCGRLVRGFESCLGHRYLSLVFMYCVVLCSNGLSTHPEESYCVSSCMCDHRNPKRGPMFQVGNLQENERMNDHSHTS